MEITNNNFNIISNSITLNVSTSLYIYRNNDAILILINNNKFNAKSFQILYHNVTTSSKV